MSTPRPTLIFPHEELTPVTVPNPVSLQRLSKELFTNALNIPSRRGTGQHGHLQVIMSDVQFAQRTVGQVPQWDAPIHPGNAPVHAANATAAAIAENIRLYNMTIAECDIYNQVQQTLKKQILQAVPDTYLAVLQDALLGYADVTPRTMLEYLMTKYGQVKPEDIESNRAKLQQAWNPDDPIETVWTRIQLCTQYAVIAGEPLPVNVILRLSLTVFEETGTFSDAVKEWRKKALPDRSTIAQFQEHFTYHNDERIHILTAAGGGFHGANLAIVPTPTDIQATIEQAVATAVAAAYAATSPPTTPTPAPAPAPNVLSNNVQLYYCWSHGLGRNRNHTSATCNRKRDGHKDEATINNMMGGSNILMQGCRTPNS